MPASDATAALHARADDPTTEIFLVDGSLERLASGVGVLDWRGRPGLYKVRFRAGRTQRDVLVELTPGPDPVRVTGEVLFSTPVPLRGTSTSHEYHQAGAGWLSRSVHASPGSGARILVLVRDYDPVENDDGPVCAGLTLHDAGGALLYDLTQGHAERNPGQAAWGGAQLEVDPGAYRLRLRLDDNRVLEQTVVACGGWTTQVFLARAADKPDAVPQPDLMGGAVLMARTGAEFDALSDAARWTEMLRRALESGRPGVPAGGEPLERLIQAASDSPMLGLLAAHTLLAGGPESEALARRIADDLHPALAGHPDAVALRLALSPSESAPPFTVPPMLRSSWTIALTASARQTGLIPPDSLAARVASRVVSSGAWTVWMLADEALRGQENPADAAPAGPAPGDPAAAESGGAPLDLDELEALIAGSRQPGALHPDIDPSLTLEEANLLRMLWLRVPVPQAAQPAAASPPAPAPKPKPKKQPKKKKQSKKKKQKDAGFGALGADVGFGGADVGFGGGDLPLEAAGPAGASFHAGGDASDSAELFGELLSPSAPPAEDYAVPDAPAPPLMRAPNLDEMVRTLQLPAGSVRSAARGLLEKLSRRGG